MLYLHASYFEAFSYNQLVIGDVGFLPSTVLSNRKKGTGNPSILGT